MRLRVPSLVVAILAVLSALAGHRAQAQQLGRAPGASEVLTNARAVETVKSDRSADDLAEIVRRSVTTDSLNWERARNYTFIQRNLKKNVDSRGNVTSQESETFEVMILYGQPYRKLIARNDRPLSPREDRKEREKLDKLVAERQRETPVQRARRLAEYEKQRRKQREFASEISEAFEFRLLGEERISGHDAWKIEGIPKPGYKPRNAQAARILPKVRGSIWIDKTDYQWVKLDAETIDTVSFGGVVARLAKGARFRFEQTRVNDEVWLPVRAEVAGSARLLLVKRMGGEVEITFRDYRKFQTDSRLVSTSDAAEPEGPGKKPARF